MQADGPPAAAGAALGEVRPGRLGGAAHLGDVRTVRAVRVALVVLPFGIASIYLALGVGYVLDDWFSLREVALEGSWRPVPSDQVAPRPGAALLWILQFGAFGLHPLPSILLMAALLALSAVLLHRVLVLVVPAGMAHATALLWVLLPTHTALEAWHSCSQITLSLALGLLALLLALRDGAWRVLAVVLGAAGAFVWFLLHYGAAKGATGGTSDLSAVVPANFSWGIAPSGPWATITGVVIMVGLVVILASWWLWTCGRGPAPMRRRRSRMSPTARSYPVSPSCSGRSPSRRRTSPPSPTPRTWTPWWSWRSGSARSEPGSPTSPPTSPRCQRRCASTSVPSLTPPSGRVRRMTAER